jgi:hypothetical protein
MPQVSFEYIFGSEEYYEWVNSKFNDVFAFFLNGQNIALLPDGVTEVAINNVNFLRNSEYYRGNDIDSGGINYPLIEADGFTTKLIATGPTIEGEWNTIKLAIADVDDRTFDSYVIVTANSFTCVPRTEQPSMSPSPSSEPTEIPSTSVAPTVSAAPSTDDECMIFETMPVDELVRNIFKDPDGEVEFRNVVASNHACFLRFYNGHQMGNHKVTGEQLIQEEGIIMGSGKPEDFCWNDSDEMTTQWRTSGDADLTNLVRAETYDAVSFPSSFVAHRTYLAFR